VSSNRIWDQNKIPLLDIDVKGAIHVHEQFDEGCLTIFIEPPSVEELQRRLEARGTGKFGEYSNAIEQGCI
jgi:guanylate kinase